MVLVIVFDAEYDMGCKAAAGIVVEYSFIWNCRCLSGIPVSDRAGSVLSGRGDFWNGNRRMRVYYQAGNRLWGWAGYHGVRNLSWICKDLCHGILWAVVLLSFVHGFDCSRKENIQNAGSLFAVSAFGICVCDSVGIEGALCCLGGMMPCTG